MKRALPLALVGVLLFVAGATAATLATSASQPKAGTPKAPNPETLSLALSQIGFASNKPSRTLVSVAEQLPVGFSDRIALFPTCPNSDFASVGNDPPPCPTGSQVGTITFKAYVPSLNVTANAAGNIYSTGNNTVQAWVLATIPGYKLAVAVPGKLTGASSANGPSVTWDLSAAINFGVTADITDFATTWSIVTIPVTTTTTTPAARAAVLRSSSSHKSRTKTKTTTKNLPESTFETTSCKTGSWGIGATLTYKSGSPESDSASITCQSATAPAPPSTTATTAPTTTTSATCVPVVKVCLRASVRSRRAR